MGVPFLHLGRTRAGLDCAGLLRCALVDLGNDPPDVAGYGKMPHQDRLREAVEAFYGPEASPPLQVGDVVLTAQKARYDAPRHIAIVGDYVLGGLSLIHCRADVAAKVCEQRLDDTWLALIRGVYR